MERCAEILYASRRVSRFLRQPELSDPKGLPYQREKEPPIQPGTPEGVPSHKVEGTVSYTGKRPMTLVVALSDVREGDAGVDLQ